MAGQRLRYVAVAHVNRVGEIEQVNLCDSVALCTYMLWPATMPEWFTDRVTLMRFVSGKELVPIVNGRKYSDYMIVLHLTDNEFQQLYTFRIER